MRISDWSSDVCSSDLLSARRVGHRAERVRRGGHAPHRETQWRAGRRGQVLHCAIPTRWQGYAAAARDDRPAWAGMRSEEHTSEPQSLMSISYAVFCLKKKKNPI